MTCGNLSASASPGGLVEIDRWAPPSGFGPVGLEESLESASATSLWVLWMFENCSARSPT